VLIVNDSRVIRARLLTRASRSGAPVELLFVAPETGRRWRALVRPGRRCPVGAELAVSGDVMVSIVGIEADGSRIVEPGQGTIPELLDAYGVPPLPPYIERHLAPDAGDRDRYQTVYAREPGSVAAPTAGLHFSEGLVERIRRRGIEIHAITLHVGPGTFRPIRAPRVEHHVVDAERVTVPDVTAAAVNVARAEGRRVVAVGTTTTRALEAVADPDGRLHAFEGDVDLYIRPGHRFRAVDALVTNFHLPRSSLLVLVVAFAGHGLVMKAYRHAIDGGYRFYSYGDATLIV
jgi:S-adenosylmethionine:tRNA ribosyltransferase-isomerase